MCSTQYSRNYSNAYGIHHSSQMPMEHVIYSKCLWNTSFIPNAYGTRHLFQMPMEHVIYSKYLWNTSFIPILAFISSFNILQLYTGASRPVNRPA